MDPANDDIRAHLRALGIARERRGQAGGREALDALLGAAAERAGRRSTGDRLSGAFAGAGAVGLCAVTFAGAQLAHSPAGHALDSPLRLVVRRAFEPSQLAAEPPSSVPTDDEDR